MTEAREELRRLRDELGAARVADPADVVRLLDDLADLLTSPA